ncbi:MAG: T9SS type A sorting domain-containing protein [Putridiphycobacter sp.]
MKKILFYILLISFYSNAQFNDTIINNRYAFDYNSSVFGNIEVTDSGYFVIGVGNNTYDDYNDEYIFSRLNFDGSVNFYKSYTDTVGLGLNVFPKNTPCLTKTLDGHFAHLVFTVSAPPLNSWDLIFLKFDANGDTLVTNYINQFTSTQNRLGYYPTNIIQNSDSSYYCAVQIQPTTSYIDNFVIFKLDKNGELLWFKKHNIDVNYLNSNANSLLKFDENRIIISGIKANIWSVNPPTFRSHPYFLVTDSLGNFIEDYTEWQDTIILKTNSLIKTKDGDMLYSGSYGRLYPDEHYDRYKACVTMIDESFNVLWRINYGVWSNAGFNEFNKILEVNDSEFVAVGNGTDFINGGPIGSRSGVLLKFNLRGDILWQRKYVKIQAITNAIAPYHYLYDVEMTRDSGFIMVGQVGNTYPNEFLPGQKGWVVKTDKYGCLVPSCQKMDNPKMDTVQFLPIPTDTTKVDTTDTTKTVNEATELYPNPVSTNLFYYFAQSTDDFKPCIAQIFNLQGQLIQEFSLSTNHVTYMIDVSQYAAGTYIFKVITPQQETLKSTRFLVAH